MKNKRILFTGYYGFENLGDDMFGLVSTWGAKKYWNNTDTALMSRSGPVTKDFKIKYAISQNKKFIGQGLLQSYIETFRTDYVILSGGSILFEKPEFYSQRRLAYLLTRLNLLKMGAIGVSLGPFKLDKDYKYIESVLKSFKFLTLRDRKSYDIACSMDLPYRPILAADLAFILPRIKEISLNNNKKSENRIVGISLCHYERYVGKDINNERRREGMIYAVLNELKKKHNIKFRFFIINGHSQIGDLELTQEIIKQLELTPKEYELIPYSSNTLKIFDFMGSCDIMYSTRLHGAIFAAAANIPSLLVEYHQKCTEYLNDIGLEDKWRIGDMKVSPMEVATKIKKLLENKQNNFYPNRQKLLDLSKKNFTDQIIFKEIK